LTTFIVSKQCLQYSCR